jgi:ferredoxin-thioredoxin reductase catalytic chain
MQITENTAENSKLSNEKTLEAMKNFSETYAKRTGTYFCSEPSVTAVVIEGLAKHKDELGAPLCPCRHYEDKEAEVKAAYWNCPCIPMRERKECHCMLFLTPDNDFAGTNQEISMEQLQTVRETM